MGGDEKKGTVGGNDKKEGARREETDCFICLSATQCYPKEVLRLSSFLDHHIGETRLCVLERTAEDRLKYILHIHVRSDREMD